uniref:Uncharacterized protein n=1 Tax=Rhizophora mucronata TaxID=61149 RepID=A0A2P2QNC6_RHIMU
MAMLANIMHILAFIVVGCTGYVAYHDAHTNDCALVNAFRLVVEHVCSLMHAPQSPFCWIMEI